MNEEQKTKAVQMALEGKTIAKISEGLNLEWSEVSAFLHSEGVRGFQGSKTRITNRLNRLSKENDPDKREELVVEVKALVDYIYYSGKDMGRLIDRARKALGSEGARLTR